MSQDRTQLGFSVPEFKPRTPPTAFRPIDTIATRASFWAAMASLVIVVIFTLITLLEEKHSVFQTEEKRLGTIAGAMARAVSAEMLVGDRRSLAVLLTEYRQKYGLNDIEILDDRPVVEEDTSAIFAPDQAKWVERLPGITPPRYLVLSVGIHGKEGLFSGLWTVVWVCVPLFIFGVFITLRIQKDLRRSIVQPIQDLARDPEAWKASGPWVAEEARTLHRHLVNYIRERDTERDKAERLKIEASIGEVAAQVAHDIRSPLAALDMVAAHIDQIPEEKRIIIRTALSRIRDIANGLLDKHRSQLQGTSGGVDASPPLTRGTLPAEMGGQELLSNLVDSLVTEKRMQFRSRWGVQIEAPLSREGYGLFAKVNGSDFNRVLSNLINNSVEAVGERGRIRIELGSRGNQVFVRVRDDGPGIPEHVLPKLMQRGETHGKSEGSGLGLYSAKRKIEEWGGDIKVTSTPREGTSVEILLPRVPAPDWFVSQLSLPPGTVVVILDDDTTIHQIWDGRFESLQLKAQGVECVHLSTGTEFARFVLENQSGQLDRCLFLVDYELIGSVKTGLDYIEELNLGPQSILVTSRFEEKDIKRRCVSLGIRMIPKSLAGFVPIRLDKLARPALNSNVTSLKV